MCKEKDLEKRIEKLEKENQLLKKSNCKHNDFQFEGKEWGDISHYCKKCCVCGAILEKYDNKHIFYNEMGLHYTEKASECWRKVKRFSMIPSTQKEHIQKAENEFKKDLAKEGLEIRPEQQALLDYLKNFPTSRGLTTVIWYLYNSESPALLRRMNQCKKVRNKLTKG